MGTIDEPLLPAGEQPKLLPAPENKDEQARRPSGRRMLLVGFALLIVLGILFLVGYLPRHRRSRTVEAAAEREANAIPAANVTKVQRSPSISTLLLPGTTTPVTEAYIYARSSGYVRRRYVDIGDRVRAGQALAEIEAPDLDAQVAQARASLAQAEQQLRQAEAQLENAQSQEELARVTWDRYRVLVDHGAVSRQEADQQQATYRSATANVRLQQAAISTAEENVRANRASLERIVTLQEFEKVRAPFEGVITARNFDVGALISAGGSTLGASSTAAGGTQVTGNAGNGGAGGAPPSSGAGGGELFRIAQIGVLRVLVNVPQANAPTIRVGQPAKLFVQEFSGRNFSGKVTRTANSLDQTSRTLLTEVQVVNSPQILLPGMYAQVQFADMRAAPPLLVPGDAVIAGPEGLRVAILEEPTEQQRPQEQQKQENVAGAKRIHLQPVQVGRDYGPQIEITGGLQGWEYVVVNPADFVQEGALIMPQQAPAAEAGSPQQRRGQSEQQSTSIGSPSRDAPTEGPQNSGKKSGNNHQGGRPK